MFEFENNQRVAELAEKLFIKSYEPYLENKVFEVLAKNSINAAKTFYEVLNSTKI